MEECYAKSQLEYNFYLGVELLTKSWPSLLLFRIGILYKELSTELLNLKNLTSYTDADMDLKEARAGHGLVEVHYNNQPTVIAIGGVFGEPPMEPDELKKFFSIEIWHPANKTWSLAPELKLSEPKVAFGFISVPTHLICQPWT